MPRGEEGRDWGDAPTSQEIPKIASKPPAARGEAWKRTSLTAPGAIYPADTVILDFQPPEP